MNDREVIVRATNRLSLSTFSLSSKTSPSVLFRLCLNHMRRIEPEMKQWHAATVCSANFGWSIPNSLSSFFSLSFHCPNLHFSWPLVTSRFCRTTPQATLSPLFKLFHEIDIDSSIPPPQAFNLPSTLHGCHARARVCKIKHLHKTNSCLHLLASNAALFNPCNYETDL